jgi:hypothetical protein
MPAAPLQIRSTYRKRVLVAATGLAAITAVGLAAGGAGETASHPVESGRALGTPLSDPEHASAHSPPSPTDRRADRVRPSPMPEN